MARGQRGWRVVRKSGHEEEIRDLLCSGWSTRRVRDYLQSTHSLDIAESVLRYYRETQMDPALILPASVLKTALKGVNLRIDVLTDLGAVLRKQEERLSMELQIEERISKLLPTTVKEMEFYWKALMEYAQLLQTLGQLPMEPQKIKFDNELGVKLGPGPTLRDLMRELEQDREQAKSPDEPE